MSDVILEAGVRALRALRAQHQDDLASAEQKYSDALRELGLTERANEVASRAASHRAYAERIRGGVA